MSSPYDSAAVEDKTDYVSITDDEALEMHRRGRPGKIEITPTKPLTTQRDLSLAYSPGVAAPCLAIKADPSKVYDYTVKGNLVAVISNGTAVLGLGNLGALAAKPVMEGKSVLFKRFADIDAIDLEVDTEDVDAFVNCVRLLEPTFGGINLEDIKAPGCFIIEQQLREAMDIPVFHDDQHGTAIIAAAGLINALDVTGRTLRDVKLVVNGAGAAAIACIELLKAMGLPHDNAILCDTQGVVWRGREAGMNQWKSGHAVDTDARTLAEALVGADVFFGLSAKGALGPEMTKGMARQPIVFAMANPDPEIMPEALKEVRPDALIATGRSDYPNQVNNVLGFPYIFRGALDVRATTINDPMKIAAAYAIAALAREDVPDEVSAAYRGRRLRYGPNYLIPTPFDPRLIVAVPSAVAQAAMSSAVARVPIGDREQYCDRLRARLDPTASRMQLIIDRVRAHPKRVVFAEGEEEKTIRAALAWHNAGLGTPVLIGREERIHETAHHIGLNLPENCLEIHNARLSTKNRAYAELLYGRSQRAGLLFRDCQRLVNQDRNVFGACMVAEGDADAMVTGLTRNYISRAARHPPGDRPQARRAPARLHDDAGARPDCVHRGYHRARAAHSLGARRHRDPDRPRRPPHGLHAPRRPAFVFDLRQPPDREGAARPGGGGGARPAPGRLRVRRRDVGGCRPRSRAAGALPVLPPVRARERPDHAGPAYRQHQLAPAQAAGWRHGDRPVVAGPVQAGPDPVDERLGLRDDQPRSAGRLRRDPGRAGADRPGGGVNPQRGPAERRLRAPPGSASPL